ncbi:MAG: response regulator transcription factor [Flavisolibacter sp.]|jgi:DNA-binding NarL/FixJ family response regulator|nr:response regulator transcription factor [Flavisolibacter sp.]
MKIKVGLVDDHQLFLKSLSLMLETLQNFEVVVEALNGQDLQRKLEGKNELPDLMLVDVNMPLMDGIETTAWLTEHHPSIKIIALSMNDKDTAIIKMFKAGCCAYLLKDVHPSVLEKALHEVYKKGYYNSDAIQLNPGHFLKNPNKDSPPTLTPKEQHFLKYVCSELTYKQIAGEMQLSERTVDGYRESLFQKFGVQSRVGLCLEALRKEFVSL